MKILKQLQIISFMVYKVCEEKKIPRKRNYDTLTEWLKGLKLFTPESPKISKGYKSAFNSLNCLLELRNFYWGDWNPSDSYGSVVYYAEPTRHSWIETGKLQVDCSIPSKLFIFPTKEMRDLFCEKHKNLFLDLKNLYYA